MYNSRQGIIGGNLIIKREDCSTFNEFMDKIEMEQNRKSPETISRLRPFPIEEMRNYTDRLDDTSDEFYDSYLKYKREQMEEIKKISVESLHEEERISYNIFTNQHELITENFNKYRWHGYNVSQRSGVYNVFPYIMTVFHDIEAEIDAEHYIARLWDSRRRFRETIDYVNKGIEINVILPKLLLEQTITGINDFIEHEIDSNILMQDFAAKLDKAGIISDKLLDNARQAMKQAVYPAYEELAGAMMSLYGKTNDDAGVWKFKNGDEYYKFTLKARCWSTEEPEEIFNTGISEVARIEEEVKKLFSKTKYDADSIKDSYAKMHQDEQFLYPETEEGRKQCIKDLEKIMEEAETRISDYVEKNASMKCIIERVETFREKNASGGAYRRPSMDGKRPPSFMVNLREMKELPKFMMRTLLYHEALPGHHYQLDIERGLDLPLFRKNMALPAFCEGWALYAEKLAYEAGWHPDVYSNLGRLNDELMRAVRCVVDTGIHYRKWTRQQAIDYMEEHTGKPMPTIITEIDRYIVWPGQAVTYKLGEMKILELREKARQILGARFNIKHFHTQVLKHGKMPMDMLEQSVDKWIQSYTDD